MENTSPKKYIQTRARSLPIYKCYASRGWEGAGLANVIVIRRHVNKKFTGGMYLVDLRCLGIKDTSWFFNITEEAFLEPFPDFQERFMEVEYNLAHNIIYAGHDFAMEFDIGPQQDFAITRFILEEDNDKIPIIDIAVGDADGTPHLMTYGPNEHLDALAKLKKNAGEGNFHYTYGIGEFSEDEEYDDDDLNDDNLNDDDPYLLLSEIEPGTVDPQIVKDVVIEDLVNPELLKLRDEREQLICMAEAFIRIVEPKHPLTSDEDILMEKERDYYYENDLDYSESEMATYQECIKIMNNDAMVEQAEKDEDNKLDISRFEKSIHEAKGNPVFAALLNMAGLLMDPEDEKLTSLIIVEMNKLSRHDIIQMSFALRGIVTNDPVESCRRILEQPGYDNVFSGKTENFHEDCLTLFYMVQVIRYSQSNKIALAIGYYHLLSGQHENLLFAFGHALFYPVFIDALVRQVPLEMSPMSVNREP